MLRIEEAMTRSNSSAEPTHSKTNHIFTYFHPQFTLKSTFQTFPVVTELNPA